MSTSRGVVLPQSPLLTAADTLTSAELAIDLGYDELWISETSVFDPFAMAGHLAHPAGPRLILGPLPAPLRSGPQLAMAASTLLALGAECELVLGASSPTVTQSWHGRTRSSPALVRAVFEATKAALSGERTAIDSGPATTVGFRLGTGPARVKIGVAALGPKMLRLAGECADRAVLNMVGPAQAHRLAEVIADGARAANRAVPPISIWLHVAVEPDEIDVAIGHQFIAGYLRAPGYAASFAQQGFGEIVDRAAEATNLAEVAELVSDELYETIIPHGDADHVRKAVTALEQAGFAVAVVPVMASHEGRARTLEALMTR